MSSSTIERALTSKPRLAPVSGEYKELRDHQIVDERRYFRGLATLRQVAIIRNQNLLLHDETMGMKHFEDTRGYFRQSREALAAGLSYNQTLNRITQDVMRVRLRLMLKHDYHPYDLKLALAKFLLQCNETDWSYPNCFLEDANTWDRDIEPALFCYQSRIEKLAIINQFLAASDN